MSRVDSWLTNTSPLSPWLDHDHAVDNAIIVNDKSVSITIIRAGSPLSAQSVRIEELRGNRVLQTPAGQTYQVDAVVLGYYGHATITNTNIQPGDRFAYRNVRYEVVMLVPGLNDELQAYCKVAG